MKKENKPCPACGSELEDRIQYKERNKDSSISVELMKCPHCENNKCCMCNTGNDTTCLLCEEDEPA